MIDEVFTKDKSYQHSQKYDLPLSIKFEGLSNFNFTLDRIYKSQEILFQGVSAYKASTENEIYILYVKSIQCWVLFFGSIEKAESKFTDTKLHEISGKYYPQFIIKEKQNFYLQEFYINPSDSPIGKWYAPGRIPLELQHEKPFLVAKEQESQSIKHFIDSGEVSIIPDQVIRISQENEFATLSFYREEKTESNIVKLIKVEKKIKINPDGSFIWDIDGENKKISIGDKHHIKSYIKGQGNTGYITAIAQGSALLSLSSGNSSNVKIVGNTDVNSGIETTGVSITNREGMVTKTAKYLVKAGGGANLAKSFKRELDGTLICTRCVVENQAPWDVVTVTYEGIYQNHEAVSFQVGTTTEPIETHPKFCDFAGTAESPVDTYGAIFNDDGTFNKFPLYVDGSTELSKFAGVSGYVVPSTRATLTKFYTTLDLSDLDKVGTIDEPKGSGITADANKFASGLQNWLITDVSWRNFGKGCIVQLTFQLSGERGWDTDIYNKS